MKHCRLSKIQTQYTGHTNHFTIHIQISSNTNILTNIKSLIIKVMGNILVQEVRQITVTETANSWTSALGLHIPNPL